MHSERSLNPFYLVSASQIMVTSELNCTIQLLQHSGVQARRCYWQYLKLFSFVLDVDECSTNSHSCNVNAVCSNAVASYVCACVIQGMEGRALVKAVFLLSVNAINILCKQIIPTGVERASITKCAKTYNNSL